MRAPRAALLCCALMASWDSVLHGALVPCRYPPAGLVTAQSGLTVANGLTVTTGTTNVGALTAAVITATTVSTTGMRPKESSGL
jgi:hypothetical protein